MYKIRIQSHFRVISHTNSQHRYGFSLRFVKYFIRDSYSQYLPTKLKYRKLRTSLDHIYVSVANHPTTIHIPTTKKPNKCLFYYNTQGVPWR